MACGPVLTRRSHPRIYELVDEVIEEFGLGAGDGLGVGLIVPLKTEPKIWLGLIPPRRPCA